MMVYGCYILVGDARKKKYVQQEQAYVNKYKTIQANVAKERIACLSLWKEMQATEAEKAEADADVIYPLPIPLLLCHYDCLHKSRTWGHDSARLMQITQSYYLVAKRRKKRLKRY
jgi:hypothetical protein